MSILSIIVVVVLVLLLGIGMGVRIVKEYEKGVVFRLGRVVGSLAPGFRVIIPFVDVMHRVTLRIITMPIQSQGIITRDNVSVDVSAVAYFRVVDAVSQSSRSRTSTPPSTRSPRPRCARSSGSTPWTRRCPRPTASTRTSARSSTSTPSTGVSK